MACSLKVACLPEEGSLEPVDQDNDDMEDEEQFTLMGDFSAQELSLLLGTLRWCEGCCSGWWG